MPHKAYTMDTEWATQLVESAPDAMIVVDPAGAIVLANGQAERMFGYAREELLGQKLEMLMPERYRSRHVGHRTSFAQTPKARPMGAGLDLRARHKDGREIDVEISLSPIETRSGRFMACAIRDITDRRRIEAQAQRTASYLKSSVDSIADTFLLFDERDRLVVVNSAARVLFRTGLEGPIEGKPFESVLDAALAGDLFEAALEGSDDLRSRWLAYHHNPSGSLDVRIAPDRALRITERRTAEGGTVAVIADMSDDVRREGELLRARENAEEASAAKSEFLSSMSHELRTPLNAVLGFAQLLQRDKKTPLNERQQERLSHVLRGGEHLLRLIDDVLDLARIEAGRVSMSAEPVDLGPVLEEVISTLEPMASRTEVGIVRTPLPPDLVPVHADRTRLAQVLMNYGSNAIKYGKKGGTVAFRVERRGGTVRVTVVDDGIGIADAHRARIFEPFHRAGQETGPIEGTGIGLAISKRLAELMGGTVGFDSEVGKGSSFWVEVPAHVAARAERAPVATGPSGRPPLPTESQVVVYIEDNPSNIAFMRDMVGDFPHIELLTAPTAEIGLELCRARRPALVILDINLPGMNGFEAMRRLREWPETREVPVIGLSAAAMPRDLQRGRDAGFLRYLTKPVQVAELVEVFDQVLRTDAP